jgi:hypothetical protein
VTTFVQLNHGWNADPNSPAPEVTVVGRDVVVTFFVNAFQFPEFTEGTKATIRFKSCQRYRIGTTNDEGWYMGKCRFSKLAPRWGEFYQLAGDPDLLLAPNDWLVVQPETGSGTTEHYLFYFRDETFECVARSWEVELPVNRLLVTDTQHQNAASRPMLPAGQRQR